MLYHIPNVLYHIASKPKMLNLNCKHHKSRGVKLLLLGATALPQVLRQSTGHTAVLHNASVDCELRHNALK